MAYFSNGTEAESFKENNCYQCKNWKHDKKTDTWGCPIMDLHLLHSYDLCNSKSLAKEFLDFLIPKRKLDKKTNALIVPPCLMLLKRK